MKRSEYMRAHQQLAHDYSVGAITFEDMKLKIAELDNHEHEYERDITGESVCWCGTIK